MRRLVKQKPVAEACGATVSLSYSTSTCHITQADVGKKGVCLIPFFKAGVNKFFVGGPELFWTDTQIKNTFLSNRVIVHSVTILKSSCGPDMACRPPVDKILIFFTWWFSWLIPIGYNTTLHHSWHVHMSAGTHCTVQCCCWFRWQVFGQRMCFVLLVLFAYFSWQLFF